MNFTLENNMNQITVALGTFVGGILALVLVSFLLAWPVMELWNQCLVPATTGINQIGWLQAWGIQFLFGILFKVSIVNKKG
jgi:hypothetical protein